MYERTFYHFATQKYIVYTRTQDRVQCFFTWDQNVVNSMNFWWTDIEYVNAEYSSFKPLDFYKTVHILRWLALGPCRGG